MKPISVRVGILFSTSGSYASVGRAMRAGALLAIDEINADTELGVTFTAIEADPAGIPAAYADAAQDLLFNQRLTHVIGCYTSSSRKEVLPLFEKADGLLWYPSHYEGFETSENIVYTGAAPNQHIIPLAKHLLEFHGNRGWFVGSNYIWAWENNRILREALTEAGGEVLGERYFPVGETDLAAVVDQIVSDRPDFVFTTLIGESCYEFFRMLRRAARTKGIDQPRELPAASCSLSEVELPFIGSGAAEGHLSSSVYFSTVRTPENARFTASWDSRFGYMGKACADAEATYTALHLLARAVRAAGSADFAPVRSAVRGLRFAAPQGQVTVDHENLHCSMRPRIGLSCADGSFDIIFEESSPIRPDPYLVRDSGLQKTSKRTSDHLRIVQ